MTEEGWEMPRLDCLPHDDGPVQGVDWDYCDWCCEGAWLPPAASEDVLTKTHHVVTCPHTDADANLYACPGCIESGRSDVHPREGVEDE